MEVRQIVRFCLGAWIIVVSLSFASTVATAMPVQAHSNQLNAKTAVTPHDDGCADDPTGPYVGFTSPDPGWMVDVNGFVEGLPCYGDITTLGQRVHPIVGMAKAPDGGGYWLAASDGGIFGFGSAAFHGSMGGRPLDRRVVGIAATPSGDGYWLVASDGGVFAFGDAAFYGSMAGQSLNEPIVGIASTRDGGGYWLVASDGGVFAFGDAVFHGSTSSIRLAGAIVGMGVTDDGNGYWLAGSDGGVFAYGDAPFLGSALNLPHLPAIGISGDQSPRDYLVYGSGGTVALFVGPVLPA